MNYHVTMNDIRWDEGKASLPDVLEHVVFLDPEHVDLDDPIQVREACLDMMLEWSADHVGYSIVYCSMVCIPVESK